MPPSLSLSGSAVSRYRPCSFPFYFPLQFHCINLDVICSPYWLIAAARLRQWHRRHAAWVNDISRLCCKGRKRALASIFLMLLTAPSVGIKCIAIHIEVHEQQNIADD